MTLFSARAHICWAVMRANPEDPADCQRQLSADAPTAGDPLARYVSERTVGAPARHARPPRFWSPVRVITACTVIGILLALLTNQYCRINGWGGVAVYHHGCYSDVAALWSSRDFEVSAFAPFSPALADFEYPVLTTLFASLTAALTHGLDATMGSTLLGYWSDRSSLLFWDITFAASAAAWLVLVWATLGVLGSRRWDAVVVALSPGIIFSIGINWDILPAAALAVALWCVHRKRWVWAGLFVGVGVSLKMYPLFLLGALLTLAARRWWRAHRGTAHHDDDAGEGSVTWSQLGTVSAAAGAAWLAVNVPVMLTSFEAWSRFFVFSSERGAGYSSIWHVWSVLGETGPSAQLVSGASLGLFVLCCAAIFALGVLAPAQPRLVQLLFLIVAAFVICSKVYSPQFMIWLVPLMVLAAPRLRDLLIWHVFQLLHFWAVWMYLAGIVGDAEVQHTMDPVVYVWAVAGHILSTGYICVQVIRDIWRPERELMTPNLAPRDTEQRSVAPSR